MKIPPALLAVLLFFTGCASIPPEAPQLSARLGTRLDALQAAHRRLLADFFNDKRARVDDFIQQQWVPLFAKNFFAEPAIEATWNQVVASTNPDDRLKFIVLVGPKLQAQINAKRTELIQPLDQLEQEIALKLSAEYDQMRTVNSTLTAFLQSAAKVAQNDQRLLGALGVSNTRIDSAIGQANDVVSQLLQAAQTGQNLVQQGEAYKAGVQQLITQIRQ